MLLATIRFQVLSSMLSTSAIRTGIVIPVQNLSTGSFGRMCISEFFSEKDIEKSVGCWIVTRFVTFENYPDSPFSDYSFEFSGVSPYAYYTTCSYDSSTRLLEVSLHCNEALVLIARKETKQKLKSLTVTTPVVTVEKKVTFKKTIGNQSSSITLIRGTDGVWRDDTGTVFKRTPIIKIMATYLKDGFEVV